jgi:hypothetical protein
MTERIRVFLKKMFLAKASLNFIFGVPASEPLGLIDRSN